MDCITREHVLSCVGGTKLDHIDFTRQEARFPSLHFPNSAVPPKPR